MAKMLVFTNAREGRDEEFNRWHDETHLPEVHVPLFEPTA